MPRFKRKYELKDPRFVVASQVIAQLQEAGFSAVMVGGAVRDLLLGRHPEDYDLVTTARPEELASLFEHHQYVGASFGVSLVEVAGISLEVATAREERGYLDGRHPMEVRFTDDLEIDMQRRDFTINALWYDPIAGEVGDGVGGLEDLERGIVRTVGDAQQRFSEDFLRMLRAVRFASSLHFELSPETWQAIVALATKVSELAGERVNSELTRMLTGTDPARAMRMLYDSGLLEVLLPEVAAMGGVEQPPEYHPEGDVLVHTLLMLKRMAIPSPRLAWSVLLHDVGKTSTQTLGKDGRLHFYSHDEVGAEVAGRILDRLRFSVADRDAIVQAVREHMRFSSVCKMRSSKLRRWIADSNFPLELELHRLDTSSCQGSTEYFVFILDQLVSVPEVRKLPEPWVRGRDLVATGIKPGPHYKAVLDQTYEQQLSGELSSPEQALAFALDKFR